MQRSGLFEAILIDGSFVTSKAVPNDIDLVAVLPADHDFERELSVSEYSLVSRPLLRKRFGFDVVQPREMTGFRTSAVAKLRPRIEDCWWP